MSEHDNNIQAALDAGKVLGGLDAGVVTVSNAGTAQGEVPFALLPEGVHAQSMETYLERPVRRRAKVTIRDAESFITYVRRFSDSDSLVFANLGDRTFTAVLDYHRSAGDAQWGEHRAAMTCLLTEDWKRWMAQDKKPVSQVEFAQFIEDNLPNIALPTGSDLLGMTQNLYAKKDVQFASSVRLDNGEHQLTFNENVTATTGEKGTLSIPQSFTLGIEPFEGAGLYSVEAKFRYRITDGRLFMWYHLMRPEAVVEDAFKRTRTQIENGLNGVAVIAGAAPTMA